MSETRAPDDAGPTPAGLLAEIAAMVRFYSRLPMPQIGRAHV